MNMTFSISKMPKKGYMIANFKEKMIFEPYEIIDDKLVFDGCEILETEFPSEAHFFDKEIEYRIMYREGRKDVLDIVLDKEEEIGMDDDLIYESRELVKEEFASTQKVPEKLIIVNRYEYSENDTLVLKNYRISY